MNTPRMVALILTAGLLMLTAAACGQESSAAVADNPCGGHSRGANQPAGGHVNPGGVRDAGAYRANVRGVSAGLGYEIAYHEPRRHSFQRRPYSAAPTDSPRAGRNGEGSGAHREC